MHGDTAPPPDDWYDKSPVVYDLNKGQQHKKVAAIHPPPEVGVFSPIKL